MKMGIEDKSEALTPELADCSSLLPCRFAPLPSESVAGLSVQPSLFCPDSRWVSAVKGN